MAEEAKNKLIGERNREDQDDAKAGMFQPHVMNDEERTTWKEYVDGITQFYGEIIMRQSKKDEHRADAEDDDVKSEAKHATDAPAEALDVIAEVQETEEVFGTRIIRECNIEYDLNFFCENICTLVPPPMWPDPDKEPLP